MIRRILPVTMLVFLSCFLLSCKGSPVEVRTTELAIKTELKEDRATFLMGITAGLLNSSADTVVTDYSGTLKVVNDETGSEIFVFPLEVERLMPMETVEVVLNKTGNEDTFRPLFELMAIDMDEVIKSGEAGPIMLNESYIKLEDISYSKVPVVQFLEEKADEDK